MLPKGNNSPANNTKQINRGTSGLHSTDGHFGRFKSHDVQNTLSKKSSCCVLGPHHMFPSLCVAWFRSTADGCARLLKKYPGGVVCRPSNLGVAALVQDSVHLGDPAGQAAFHLFHRPVGQGVGRRKHGCGARVAKQPRLFHARRNVRQWLH